MSLAEQQRQAMAVLSGFATADEPLAPYTTYKLGGPATVFATPRTVDELRRVAEAMRASGLPVLVVGRGSNLLVADAGFPGIAVSLASLADAVEIDGTTVVAGAAVALPVLARRTAALGLTGFEWAVGVPGSIGGAVRMNAGGHGSDMAASLVGVHVLDLHSGHHGWVEASRLHLRFRGSELGDHQVVIDATLQLAHGDAATAEATLTEIVRWRREHQPGGQNAGSVFVNPVPGELAAAQLIDGLGLRGFTIGGAHVSEKHANFIQATEAATAADVRAVIEHVRDVVFEATGFLLRSEVRLVGFLDVEGDHREGVAW
ncbi:MAG: UDP-N-acetylmuramate dehydrogenase [Actinobacteria bacterium]|nr:UDP-N-acetylmuramate dehydrogenase [Actinomycetota bacterium]